MTTEAEWPTLLSDPAFLADLMAIIEAHLADQHGAEQFLLIQNWTKDAHAALLPMLPDRLAGAFDLSAFRPDGSVPRLDETEGFDLLCAGGICPAGWDPDGLLPDGSPRPLGPYADIVGIRRIPLPIRLDLSSNARVRVMQAGNDLVLMVEQFRCGQAHKLCNGMFCVEEEVDGGKATVVLSAEAQLNTAADLLLAAGQRQAIELAPPPACAGRDPRPSDEMPTPPAIAGREAHPSDEKPTPTDGFAIGT